MVIVRSGSFFCLDAFQLLQGCSQSLGIGCVEVLQSFFNLVNRLSMSSNGVKAIEIQKDRAVVSGARWSENCDDSKFFIMHVSAICTAVNDRKL